MNIVEKSVAAVSAILAATRNDEIKWVKVSDPQELYAHTENFVKTAFYGEFKGKKLVIYENTFKVFLDDVEFVWETNRVLAFSEDRKATWKFPHSQLIDELYEAAVLKAYDIESTLDSLIDEDWI